MEGIGDRRYLFFVIIRPSMGAYADVIGPASKKIVLTCFIAKWPTYG